MTNPQPHTDGPATTCSFTAARLLHPAGEIVVLRIVGVIHPGSRHQVRTVLGALFGQRPAYVLLDLSRLDLCEVGGLSVLVHAGLTAGGHGIGFAVAAAPGPVERAWSALWPDGMLPARHPTVGAGVIAAVAHRNERYARSRVAPPVPSGRRALRVVPDPDRSAEAADRRLIRRARDGDVGSYRSLVRRHRTRLYRSAISALDGSGDSDEVFRTIAEHLRTALAAFATADATHGG